MKWFRFGIPFVVVVGLIAASLPASAALSTATCFGSWKVTFSPGLGTTAQEVDSRVENGTIQCMGAVQGSPVTGHGVLAQEGRIHGTALGGTGSGTVTVVIPTLSGVKTVSFDETFTYGPGIGLKSSDSLVGPFTFMFVPTAGDGIFTPVTEIAAVGVFTLKS